MTKRPYTCYSSNARREAKRLGLGSAKEFADAVLARAEEQFGLRFALPAGGSIRLPTAATTLKVSAADAQAGPQAVCCQVDAAAGDGDAAHLFLPGGGFCDWLVSCVAEAREENALATAALYRGKACCVLHFPTDCGRASCAFAVLRWGEGQAVDLYGEQVPSGGAVAMRRAPGPPDGAPHVAIATLKHMDGQFRGVLGADAPGGAWNPDTVWYCKLVCGLGMYCDCFPEAVAAGPPADLKQP